MLQTYEVFQRQEVLSHQFLTFGPAPLHVLFCTYSMSEILFWPPAVITTVVILTFFFGNYNSGQYKYNSQNKHHIS